MKTIDIKYGMENIPEGYKIITREGVKGVIIIANKILMIRTNQGDYKFPGGGVEINETFYEALHREMLEETGFQIKNIGDVLVKTYDKKEDKYEVKTIFEMRNTYIKCELKNCFQNELELDEYEQEQDFCPIFVEIDEAIANNKKILNNVSEGLNDWLIRDTDVLEVIKMKSQGW